MLHYWKNILLELRMRNMTFPRTLVIAPSKSKPVKSMNLSCALKVMVSLAQDVFHHGILRYNARLMGFASFNDLDH